MTPAWTLVNLEALMPTYRAGEEVKIRPGYRLGKLALDGMIGVIEGPLPFQGFYRVRVSLDDLPAKARRGQKVVSFVALHEGALERV